MTTQPGDTQPQPDETQAQAGESRESRSGGAMIRWPRDLTGSVGRLAAFRGYELAVPRHQGRRIR